VLSAAAGLLRAASRADAQHQAQNGSQNTVYALVHHKILLL
jgi:hypothetical protein